MSSTCVLVRICRLCVIHCCRRPRVHAVITQNVDRLHLKAGSRQVIQLHGDAFKVNCLSCKQSFPRDSIHEKMLSLNREWLDETGLLAMDRNEVRSNPDGDVNVLTGDGFSGACARACSPPRAALPSQYVCCARAGFCVPDCPHCAGILKPDIVFFGENVPQVLCGCVKAALFSFVTPLSVVMTESGGIRCICSELVRWVVGHRHHADDVVLLPACEDGE